MLCHTFSPDFCCHCQLSFVCRCSSVDSRPVSNSGSIKHMNGFRSTDHVPHLEGRSRWLRNWNFRASVSSSNPRLSWHEVFVVTLEKNTKGHFSQKQFIYTLLIRPLKQSVCQSNFCARPSPLAHHQFFVSLWKSFSRKKPTQPQVL